MKRIFLPRFIRPSVLNRLNTPELLESLNFVAKSSSGIYHHLPLGHRTIEKLTDIVHRELHESFPNVSELALASISPRRRWEKTNRWNNNEMYRLDNDQFCLVPTCEEDITKLMTSHIKSYKDMPVLAYQVTKKFRNEKRPRNGLLRTKEFLMLDAYSFVESTEDAKSMFNEVNEAFIRIFKRLKIPFAKAVADNGYIGGDQSIEYHYLHDVGEDKLFYCPNCHTTSTQDKTESLPGTNLKPTTDVTVKYALNKSHDTLFCFYFPSDRQLNWNLASIATDYDLDSALKEFTDNKILTIFQNENNDPMFNKVVRMMDSRISSRSNFPDFPLKQYLKNNFSQITDVNLVNSIEGEICGLCGESPLQTSNSIEVGHTFNLNTKYSEAMKLNYNNAENTTENNLVKMGCYGIGISRVVAAIAEVNRDSLGLRWPSPIAPYLVSICSPPKTEEMNEKIVKVVTKLTESSQLANEILQLPNGEDNNTTLFSQISTSHAIGIPICIIVGSKTWPRIEIEVRGKRLKGDTDAYWKIKYNHLKDQYQWEVYQENTTEKHVVHLDHANDVIEFLLKDI